MKVKEKRIEEMAHKLCRIKCSCIDCLKRSRDNGIFINKEDCKCYLHAKILFKYYQPKIPEDSVVLSREEYEDLQVGKDFDYGYHEGFKNTEAYYVNFMLPKERKETAEKILNELNRIVNKNATKVNRDDYECCGFIYMIDCGDISLCLYKLAKQFNVDLKY